MRGANARWGHLITAMVAPMAADGSILPKKAGEIARFLIDNGSDAVVVNGTTGESPTTTHDEKIALLRGVIAAVGKDRVIAGAGGNNTAEVVELAHRSAEAGASGILSVAPYYNRPSQEGLYQHFCAVARAAGDLPVLLYNVPGRTITNIDASTTARLAANVPNIVGTKEASANLAQVAEIARTTPDDFLIYSGDDATVLPTLAIGGAGVISVISHVVGRDLARVCRAWFDGDPTAALAAFVKTLPVTRAIFSAPSPGPIKYALSLIGPDPGPVRLPLVELTNAEKQIVKQALCEYGLTFD
jgi:4-hydroxy-tetrahydrodipicolinate synthase